MNRAQAHRRKTKHKQQGSGCFRFFSISILIVTILLLWAIFSSGETRPSSSLPQNPYGPEDFMTQDGYITCTAGPSRLGLDVSEHQGEIDWNQVRDAGFQFALIRIGYRGYTSGSIYPDDYAAENLAGARDAGLDVGVYFYAQAVSTEEALEEARWCLDFLDGLQLELPVVYDWEYAGSGTRTADMDRKTLTDCVKTFCAAIEEAGYKSMIYFNSHVARDLLNLKELTDYPWWLAMYKPEPDFPHRIDIWQYTETGKVPGIQGDVDIDLMFLYN